MNAAATEEAACAFLWTWWILLAIFIQVVDLMMVYAYHGRRRDEERVFLLFGIKAAVLLTVGMIEELTLGSRTCFVAAICTMIVYKCTSSTMRLYEWLRKPS